MAAYSYILLTTNIGGMEIYGIATAMGDCENKVITESIMDIGNNKNAVETFIKRCNEYQLSPCHLMDAVDDFLGEI